MRVFDERMYIVRKIVLCSRRGIGIMCWEWGSAQGLHSVFGGCEPGPGASSPANVVAAHPPDFPEVPLTSAFVHMRFQFCAGMFALVSIGLADELRVVEEIVATGRDKGVTSSRRDGPA